MTENELQILENELSQIVGMYLNATNIFANKLGHWWQMVKANIDTTASTILVPGGFGQPTTAEAVDVIDSVAGEVEDAHALAQPAVEAVNES